ncbi:MAG: hypothetical protein ACKVOM_09320 [Ferruginibacter sp.]
METIGKPSKIFFICIIILAGIFFFRGFKADSKIKSDHRVVCGVITNIKYSKGGLIDYEYIVGLKKIKAAGSCTVATMQNYNRGINKIFIVFEKADPTNSELLETKNDFDKYNILTGDTIGVSCSPLNIQIQD